MECSLLSITVPSKNLPALHPRKPALPAAVARGPLNAQNLRGLRAPGGAATVLIEAHRVVGLVEVLAVPAGKTGRAASPKMNGACNRKGNHSRNTRGYRSDFAWSNRDWPKRAS